MPLRNREMRMGCAAVAGALCALSCVAMAGPAKPLTPDAAVAGALCALSCVAMAGPAKPLTPDSVVSDYCAAWSVTDRGARDRMLAQVWASDGVYSDPEPTLAAGRAALSDAIADFQHHYPGTHFRCSAPQMHHRFMRVTWVLLRANGTQVTHGVDFYDMVQDGHIQRIVGFFGEPPAIMP